MGSLAPLRGYVPLLRFVVLFWIWGTAASQYRIYMDLSIRGVILDALFYPACVLVFVGLFTRSSMVLLGLTLIARAALVGHHWSAIGGVLALASAALPIGGYYSVDRYLQLRGAPSEAMPAARADPLPIYAKILALAFIAFIILGPATIQVGRVQTRAFIHWNMYDIIGVGNINANYYDVSSGKPVFTDYIEARGYTMRRAGIHHNHKLRHDMRLTSRKRLAAITGEMCALSAAPQNLRLVARIATVKQGWQPIFTGSERICVEGGR